MLPCSSASRRAEGKGESHGQQNLDKRRTILLFLHVSRLAILASRTYLWPVSIRDPRYAYADTCVIPMDPISTISTPHYLSHVHAHSCTFPRVSAHGMSPHMGRSLTAHPFRDITREGNRQGRETPCLDVHWTTALDPLTTLMRAPPCRHTCAQTCTRATHANPQTRRLWKYTCE